MIFIYNFFEKILDFELQNKYNVICSQEWRNWQTRRLQVPVVAISCGFKSHLLHSVKREEALIDIGVSLFL